MATESKRNVKLHRGPLELLRDPTRVTHLVTSVYELDRDFLARQFVPRQLDEPEAPRVQVTDLFTAPQKSATQMAHGSATLRDSKAPVV